MSIICVLGGTGFLGSHLLKLLETESQFRVRVLSRKPASHLPPLKNGEVVTGDLLNADSLSRFLEPGAVVINLAYMPDRMPEENLRATLNLAHACAVMGVSRLIHVSTAIVAGRAADDVITEETTCRPVTQYEKTRLEIERTLLDRLSGHCSVSIIRPTEVFGESGKGLISLANQLSNGSRFINHLKLFLYSRRRLHLVYVDNVVEAIRCVMSMGASAVGQCYIVSDDDAPENNYADVARLLSGYLGADQTPSSSFECPSSVLSIVLWMAGRSDTNPHRVYSCEKLLQLGFCRPVSFQDGLKLFADWYQKTGIDARAA